MYSQITYNRSIWDYKYWIVTIFRIFLFSKFVPEKIEEANNVMTNQWQDLLVLQVWWLLSVPQPALCLLVEDAATALLASLDDTLGWKWRTASLSVSQYFNIIVWGFSVCAAFFHPLGHHPCPCAWIVRPQLFWFDPFLLSLDILPLLYLAIARDLLDPTLTLSLPLPLPYTLLLLKGVTASSSSPPTVSLIISVSLFLCPVICCLHLICYPYPPLRTVPSCLIPGLLNKRIYMIRQ